MNRTERRLIALAVGAIAAAGCGARVPAPAALDTANDQCRSCRMIVSDQRFASQIAAPYLEPVFFDDFSCLEGFLESQALPSEAVIYVADHRTKTWVRADAAVFTRARSLTSAMGSRVMAHESVASRDADPDAAGGDPVTLAAVLPKAVKTGSEP